MEKFYKVGTIVNTQGLQGEVRVMPSTDFAQERFSKGSVLALFDDKDNYIQDLKVYTQYRQTNIHTISSFSFIRSRLFTILFLINYPIFLFQYFF